MFDKKEICWCDMSAEEIGWQSSLWEVANNNFPFTDVVAISADPACIWAARCRKPKQQSPPFRNRATFQFSTSGPFFKRERWGFPLWNTKRRARPSEYIQVIILTKERQTSNVQFNASLEDWSYSAWISVILQFFDRTDKENETGIHLTLWKT